MFFGGQGSWNYSIPFSPLHFTFTQVHVYPVVSLPPSQKIKRNYCKEGLKCPVGGGGGVGGEGAFFTKFFSVWVPCVLWAPKGLGMGVGAGLINNLLNQHQPHVHL